MAKLFVHTMLVVLAFTGVSLAQKTPAGPPAGVILAEGTIVPELDPIITGSTGLSAPQTPAPLDFEQCNADCQAEKLGITFDN
ncbi:MAG: hypothetical protein AAFR39_14580 [Pseudomonadota bacterium]